MPPAVWVPKFIRFDEPENHGSFQIAGREYVVDILNLWANRNKRDVVWVKGSQLGGTSTIMAGAAWAAVNDPRRFLWVYPSGNLGDSFASTRWIPMLRASQPTKDLIPTGAERHQFKTAEQRVGGALFNFTGSNSAAGLSSHPCGKVILDEVDKYGQVITGSEADPVDLAEQRTKNATDPQRWKFSTPTLSEGLIWIEYLKGDQRRYDVLCPVCTSLHDRRILLAWSDNYTIMPKTGREAYVVWDKEARRQNGTWDLDRVHRSARFRCPHCGGDIEDSKKTWMNRGGVWTPTNPNAAETFVSLQLSSLYACTPNTSCGSLAVKFLEKKKSLGGLQGFINGDLAEPFASQDTQGKRTERIVEQITIVDNSVTLLTADVQATSPQFWFTVCRWTLAGVTVIDAGSCETVEQLRDKQIEHEVADVGVMIDSGFGARSDAEVYRNCARFGIIDEDCDPPTHCGWMPAKGQPSRKTWKDENGDAAPYFLRAIDPFRGTDKAGQIEMSLFEFAGDYFKDILAEIRKGGGPYKFEVLQSVATETFWRHMDSEIKKTIEGANGRSSEQWRLRSKHWPNHIFDCVIENMALANFFNLLKIE